MSASSREVAPPATAPSPASADPLTLLRRMIEIRLFEDEVQRLFTRGLVRGTTHLCQGQEATSVGACAALEAGDTMTCTYRGHGAVLAMGAPADRCFGEILGRADGLCRGKGGSMHLTDVSVGAMGAHAIVGAHLPIAVGLAFGARQRGDDRVSLCFFGDGTTNIGAFHEALNLAAIWRLPAVFVCENNLYGEYSPIATTTPIDELARRADAYGMPGRRIDGNEVLGVREAVLAAVQAARSGEGPTLIEAMTYRQVGHSRSDPGAYRPEGELEAWLERDPIQVLEERLREAGVAEDELRACRAAAEEMIADALSRALSWSAPDPAERFADVFA